MMQDRKIEINVEDFETLCICAVRYCIGRQSYMPSLVQGIINRFLPDLNDSGLGTINSDLKDQAEMGLWGRETIDKPGWLRFAQKVKEEMERRGHNE